jgi:ABC-type sugar transport system ATPase subunit
MGMVFQPSALYPHMRVDDNQTLRLRVRRVQRAEAERRAREIAALLEVEPLLARKPGQLSGGQQQRVALGRALVRSPRALLMDEPLSNLDAALRVRMRSEIRRIQTALETTTIFVTHDQEEAMSLADLIAVMSDGQIRQLAQPMTLYNEPADLFVARFVGLPPMNLVEGGVEDGTFRSGELAVPVMPQEPVSGAVLLGVRPERLTLTLDAAGGRTLQGRVVVVEPLGPETLVEVETAVGVVVVRAGSEGTPVQPGDSVGVRWPLHSLHLFSRETEKRIPLSVPNPQPVPAT